jgi:hypothetical protein
MKDTNVITLKSLLSLGSTFTPSEEALVYFVRTEDRRFGAIKVNKSGECYGKFLDDLFTDYLIIDEGLEGVCKFFTDDHIQEPTKLDYHLAGVDYEHR